MSDKPAAYGDDDLEEADVIAFLRKHPGVLERHGAALLANTPLRHHTGGRAVSLIERQVMLLRQENKKLERKLLNLVRVARENERLGARIQKLAVLMLEADSLEELLDAVRAAFVEEFAAEQVALRLIDSGDRRIAELPGQYRAAPDGPLVRGFTNTLQSKRVRVGRLQDAQLQLLFPRAAAAIASAAVVPLYGGREFGLLALGSSDRERFQPALGVLFLEQIGELLSAALKSRLPARAGA